MYFTNGHTCEIYDDLNNFRRHVGPDGCCLSLRKDQDNSKCSAYWYVDLSATKALT